MKKVMMILLLAFVGCRYREADKTFPNVNKFRTGQKFRITLPENHARGESWKLNDEKRARCVVQLNPVWHGNTKGIDFNFVARSQGIDTLRFTQRTMNDTSGFQQFIIVISD